MVVAYGSAGGASLASGGSTSLVLTKPSGTTAGDMLLVSIVLSANHAITPPTDTVPWNTTADAAGVKAYWKVAGASEPSSYTFERSSNANDIVGTIVRVTGAHPTAPIDTVAAQAGGFGTSIVIPSVTVGTGTFLLEIASVVSVSTFTPPATTTEVLDAQHPTSSFASAVGWENVSAGATGSRTWTATVTGARSGIMWSLIPTNAINRAGTLYPTNVATVDTAADVDVRLLATTTGTDDDSTAVAYTHANDNVERTFDPATGGATNTNNAGTTLYKRGWALRLIDDMTPVDDTNCDAILPAGTVTFNGVMVPTITGSLAAAGNLAPTWRASLWRYNPSTDTGTLIIGGNSDVSVTWACNIVSNETGVAKAVTASLVVPSQVTFSAGEVLLLQVGLNTNNVPNPLFGTMTVSFAIRTGNAGTNITFAAGQSIKQACALTQPVVGEGLAARGSIAATMTRDTTGEGLSDGTKGVIAAKTTDIVGEGLASRGPSAITQPRSLTGEALASMTRVVVAAKTFDVVGEGLVSREAILLELARNAVGEGLTDSDKAVIAAKVFDLVGKSSITETHPVQAFRTFDLTGAGELLMTGPNGSTITLPLDELPTPEGGTTTIRPIFVFDD